MIRRRHPRGRGRLRTVKLVLLSVLAVGAIGSVTVRGVYAILSGQSSNTGATIASGTLTMNDSGGTPGASTTLSANVGVTTLAANVPETTLAASVTSAGPTITVASASGFPTSGTFTIQVDSEQMTVTAGQGTTTWTVTRGVNGTTAAAHSSGASVDPTSIKVASAASFPASGSFGIRVDNETMTVTAQAGTTWTVTRGTNGTAVTSHTSGASVLQKTVTVASASGFPGSGDFTVLVDSEKLLVTGGQGTTTWTVSRAADGTTAASHASGAAVATSPCKSLNGTANVNTGCDSVLTWAPDTESYPGTPVTTGVALTDSGSVPVSDLLLYMPSCLRGITPDSPAAAATPSISSFANASTSGGYLVGGTTYYYEVTSVVSGTESVAGSEAAYTPPAGTSTNQITLNWSSVPGATAYKVYRSTTEGGEQLLATLGNVTSYVDSTATTPTGSPPSGNGSGNPCLTGNAELYVQETNASGTAKACWYPSSGTTCGYDATFDLGLFAQYYNTFNTALDLGAGPTATNTRYFQIGVQFTSGVGNSLQGTEANFTLLWYAQS